MLVYFYFSAYNHRAATPPALFMVRSLLLTLTLIFICLSQAGGFKAFPGFGVAVVKEETRLMDDFCF